MLQYHAPAPNMWIIAQVLAGVLIHVSCCYMITEFLIENMVNKLFWPPVLVRSGVSFAFIGLQGVRFEMRPRATYYRRHGNNDPGARVRQAAHYSFALLVFVWWRDAMALKIRTILRSAQFPRSGRNGQVVINPW